jgi:hypothetical protein
VGGEASAAGDQPRGGGEEPQPGPFGFPPAGLAVGEGKQLHPGGELAGHGDQGAPQLILGEPMERQVPQPGVLRDPDPVLGAGATSVPQLQNGQLALGGVGGERGDPVSVDVGDPQLRPRVRAFRALPGTPDHHYA